jgi:hypothetical protein
MKNLLLIFILQAHCFLSIGQETIIKLIFEDSANNQDTIEVGFDPAGSYLIDPELGEENIASLPFTLGLNVRISNFSTFSTPYNDTASVLIHQKRQIVEDPCENPLPIEIDIKTSNWPVTVRWDTVGFQNQCLKGSFLTNWHPGGWWDVPGEGDLGYQALNTKGYRTFSHNLQENEDFNDPFPYVYLTENKDTVSIFWLTLVPIDNPYVVGLETGISGDIILPIITENHLIWEKSIFGKYVIYNLYGKRADEGLITEKVNITELAPGGYILRIIDRNGNSKVQKFTKL